MWKGRKWLLSDGNSIHHIKVYLLYIFQSTLIHIKERRTLICFSYFIILFFFCLAGFLQVGWFVLLILGGFGLKLTGFFSFRIRINGVGLKMLIIHACSLEIDSRPGLIVQVVHLIVFVITSSCICFGNEDFGLELNLVQNQGLVPKKFTN